MAEDICVIIPIYDNAGTIRDVASRALGHCKDVFVVDDGSNDSPGKELEGLPVRLVRHDRNKASLPRMPRPISVIIFPALNCFLAER